MVSVTGLYQVYPIFSTSTVSTKIGIYDHRPSLSLYNILYNIVSSPLRLAYRGHISKKCDTMMKQHFIKRTLHTCALTSNVCRLCSRAVIPVDADFSFQPLSASMPLSYRGLLFPAPPPKTAKPPIVFPLWQWIDQAGVTLYLQMISWYVSAKEGDTTMIDKSFSRFQ